MPHSHRTITSENGSVTVLFAAVILALSSIVLVIARCESAIALAHKNLNTADLAALAGAAQFVAANPAPCPAAAKVSAENFARLTSCTVFGATVTVTIEPITQSDVFNHLFTGGLRAVAKAGL